MEGEHSLIIEVAPALAIHRICDLALKSTRPTWSLACSMSSGSTGCWNCIPPISTTSKRTGDVILKGIGRTATDQFRPRTLFADIIGDVSISTRSSSTAPARSLVLLPACRCWS